MKNIDSSHLEMQCLYMNNYINYYKKSLQILDKLPQNPDKPRLLLHACCGPCSTFPLTFLCKYFDVTIYYNNSNIFPKEEYVRRLEELEKFLGYFEKDYGYHVELIIKDYDNEKYNKILEPLKDLPEGKERCFLCYESRMSEAYDFAEKNKFDFFTTVMTISRQKNSQILNKIGEKLEKNHVYTRYFYSDFKKNKGIDIAREMRIHYELYQQLYCGCKFSYEAMLQKIKKFNLFTK